MNDKDKVLPRLGSVEIEAIIDPPIEHSYRIQLGRLGMEHLEKVAFAQREADWDRVRPLIEACLSIKACLDKYGQRPVLVVTRPPIYQPPRAMMDADVIVPLLDALAELEEKR